MKTNSILVAALIVIGAALNVNAKDPNSGLAVVPVKGSDVYKVIYKGESASRVKLNLYNEKSQIIFSETITKDGFIRPLNLTGLNPGEYTVEVVDGDSKLSEKIAHQVEASSAAAPVREKVVHVARIGGVEKFLLSIANASSETFSVNIYGENGKILFSEETAVEGSNARLYNVKNGKVSRIEVIDNAGVKKVREF